MPLWAGRLGLVYGSDLASLKGIRQVKLSHTFRSTQVAFDDPNLVSSAGLVPMLALAERAGLRSLADAQLSLPTDKGANPGLKVGPASTSASALLRYSEVSGGTYPTQKSVCLSEVPLDLYSDRLDASTYEGDDDTLGIFEASPTEPDSLWLSGRLFHQLTGLLRCRLRPPRVASASRIGRRSVEPSELRVTA